MRSEEIVRALVERLDELLEERRESGGGSPALRILASELDEAEATIESLRADLAFERDHGSGCEAAALRKQVANQKATIAELGNEIRRVEAALARLYESEGRYRNQVAALRNVVKAGALWGGKENGPGAPAP